VFLYTSIITVIGTCGETIMIFVLLGSVWSKLSLDFKIATHILHCVFMVSYLLKLVPPQAYFDICRPSPRVMSFVQHVQIAKEKTQRV
jgi:hypothetical protein